jgi:hypothetical protein
MNTAQTSDEKMSMTTGALTHIYNVKTSARNFCSSKRAAGEKYSEGVLKDSHTLFDFIMGKLRKYLGNNPSVRQYKRDFWYTEGTNQGEHTNTPSHDAECGSDDIYKWFERNQEFLTNVKEKKPKIRVVEAPESPNDNEDPDSELEWTIDDF